MCSCLLIFPQNFFRPLLGEFGTPMYEKNWDTTNLNLNSFVVREFIVFNKFFRAYITGDEYFFFRGIERGVKIIRKKRNEPFFITHGRIFIGCCNIVLRKCINHRKLDITFFCRWEKIKHQHDYFKLRMFFNAMKLFIPQERGLKNYKKNWG